MRSIPSAVPGTQRSIDHHVKRISLVIAGSRVLTDVLALVP